MSPREAKSVPDAFAGVRTPILLTKLMARVMERVIGSVSEPALFLVAPILPVGSLKRGA